MTEEPDKPDKTEEEIEIKPPLPIYMGRGSSSFFERSTTYESSMLWLITFTDIIALMLTFFVLMYSMSAPDEGKWEEMTHAVTQGLSKFNGAEWKAGPESITIDRIDMSDALNLDYLASLVEALVKKDDRFENIIITRQQDRLIISLPQDLLFEPGISDVSLEGKKALFSLGELLFNIKNRIEIVGHTDPRPVESSSYQSSWHLSLSRAINVAAVLEDVGYERPVTVMGLSSARYDELPANYSQNRKFDLARRVDIVIMKDDGRQRTFSHFDLMEDKDF